MTLYGYARVSTLDQDLTLQEMALRVAGCEVVRAEKASGTQRAGRAELELLLTFLRPGDTLVVTRIDRLARSQGPAGYRGRLEVARYRSESDRTTHRHQ